MKFYWRKCIWNFDDKCQCCDVLLLFNDAIMILKRFPHHWSFVTGNHQSPLKPPCRGPVMQGFVVFIVMLKNILNKQLFCRWVQTPWRLCVVTAMYCHMYTAKYDDLIHLYYGNHKYCIAFLATIKPWLLLKHFICGITISITHAILFWGCEDDADKSLFGHSISIMNIRNPFMHCGTI